MLDLSALQLAVHSLREALQVTQDTQWFGAQMPAVQRTLTAGVIQNFEFTYELCIKFLRRQLEAESASPAEIDVLNYRDLIRIAAERGLLTSPADWFQFREMRNITSHVYDAAKAARVFAGAARFLPAAAELLARLEGRNA